MAERLGNAGRGLDAQIGADQFVLDLLDRGRVEGPFGKVRDCPAKRRRAALEPGGEALPPGRRYRRGFGQILVHCATAPVYATCAVALGAVRDSGSAMTPKAMRENRGAERLRRRALPRKG